MTRGTVTGLSIVWGFSSALDTLASQAHGAQDFRLVGLWTARFFLIFTVMSLPIAAAWWWACAPVLRLIGIEGPTVAAAELFCRCYVVWMWPTFASRAIQSFLRAQSIVRPVSIVSVFALILHVPITWLFVGWFGFAGAPLALGANAWCVFVALLVYCRFNPKTRRCWPERADAALMAELFRGWDVLLRMGAGGAVSMMGVWWAWEILSGCAGMLGEVPLAAHVLVQQLGYILGSIFMGCSMATTARVGNLLGAGQPKQARLSGKAGIYGTTSAVGLGLVLLLLFFKDRFAYIYTDDARVAELAGSIAWAFAINQWLASNSVVLQGILNGCGRQGLNAKLSLVSSYCVGVPAAVVLCFALQLGVLGLWLGLGLGQCFRCCVGHWLVSAAALFGGFLSNVSQEAWSARCGRSRIGRSCLGPREREHRRMARRGSVKCTRQL